MLRTNAVNSDFNVYTLSQKRPAPKEEIDTETEGLARRHFEPSPQKIQKRELNPQTVYSIEKEDLEGYRLLHRLNQLILSTEYYNIETEGIFHEMLDYEYPNEDLKKRVLLSFGRVLPVFLLIYDLDPLYIKYLNEDYKLLLKSPNLTPTEKATICCSLSYIKDKLKKPVEARKFAAQAKRCLEQSEGQETSSIRCFLLLNRAIQSKSRTERSELFLEAFEATDNHGIKNVVFIKLLKKVLYSKSCTPELFHIFLTELQLTPDHLMKLQLFGMVALIWHTQLNGNTQIQPRFYRFVKNAYTDLIEHALANPERVKNLPRDILQIFFQGYINACFEMKIFNSRSFANVEQINLFPFTERITRMLALFFGAIQYKNAQTRYELQKARHMLIASRELGLFSGQTQLDLDRVKRMIQKVDAALALFGGPSSIPLSRLFPNSLG